MKISLGTRIAITIVIIQILFSAALFSTLESIFDELLENEIALQKKSLKSLFTATLSPLLFSQDFTSAQYFLSTLQKKMPNILYVEAKDQFGHIAATVGKYIETDNSSDIESIFHISFNLYQTAQPVGVIKVSYSLKSHLLLKDKLTSTFINTLIGLLLLSVFAAIFITQKQTKGLRYLVGKISSISKGEYPEIEVIKSTDEIGDLSRCFKDMVNSLESRNELFIKQFNTLKEAQRLTHIGNWEFNHDTQNIIWSDEVYRIFGYSNNDFSPNHESFIDAVYPEDKAMVNELFSNSIQNKTQYDCTHRITTLDDNIKTVHELCTTSYDNDGNPIISYGTVQDITEQKAAADHLQQNQKMDALGKLTGGVAHDFNNMLGVIDGYSSLLKERLQGQPKLLAYAAHIDGASKRAIDLTSQLLSFTRKRAISEDIVDLNKAIGNNVSFIETSLTAKIKFTFNKESSISPVKLNESMLNDSILNICINASHAMPDGGNLTITIKNIHLEQSDVKNRTNVKCGDYVSISISDTGHGMSAETKRRIFEPFYSTKGEEGTGLGMSQVYGFVEQSKGFIDVFSSLGHGTRIVLNFPIYSDKESSSTLKTQGKLVQLKGNQEIILIVDDEESLLELNKEILESNGYKVLTANNGGDALTILNNQNIDLLLTDVIMPGMDGYELAAKAMETHHDLKVQVISGFDDDRIREGLPVELYSERLNKPVSSTALLKRIQNIFKLPK